MTRAKRSLVPQAAGQECHLELMVPSAQEQLSTARPVVVGYLHHWLAHNACQRVVRVWKGQAATDDYLQNFSICLHTSADGLL